jgi:hypothetical protein
VPALLIPCDDRRPVTKTEFDLDKLWRYDAVGYDKNRVFLTKKHAYLDHRKNSLATDWVQHHSDAAKIQTVICPPRRSFTDPFTSWPSTR